MLDPTSPHSIRTVEVNEQYRFEVDDLAQTDIQPLGPDLFQVIQNGHTFQMHLLKLNREAKQCLVEVNGNRYHLQLHDQLDDMIDRLGLAKGASTAIGSVKAPMPGLVRAILVEAGQSIEMGQNVAILEAMKMENVLKAQGNGVVKRVTVAVGAAVEKNQVLIELED